MAIGAKPIVYLERKRLAFVAALAFLAGFLFYLRADVYIGGIHISLITGAVYAAVIGACALIVCIVFPSMRFMIEAVAVARLILSLFVLAVPGLGLVILANPLMTAVITVTGGVAVSRLLHGRIRRDLPNGVRNRLFPKEMFRRLPAHFQGGPWQQRFVSWLDDAEPVAIPVSR